MTDSQIQTALAACEAAQRERAQGCYGAGIVDFYDSAREHFGDALRDLVLTQQLLATREHDFESAVRLSNQQERDLLDARQEIERLTKRIAELETALKPFSDTINGYPAAAVKVRSWGLPCPDELPKTMHVNTQLLERAREVLGEKHD